MSVSMSAPVPLPASRRLTILALLVALALTSAMLAPSACVAASAAPGGPESDNPINDQGSSYNYRSYITGVVPNAPGLSVQVLEFADRLLLMNHTGRTVTILGYEGEPYARVLGDGTVEVNTHAPAYYLNQSFYAQVTVPPYASARAPARWSVLDRTGQFEWHDHRIHWMSPVPPAQVKDKGRRTKIFNWQVPLRVGPKAGSVDGQLFWVPEEGTKTPVAAIVALVTIVLLGLGLVLFVRRRRRLTGGGAGDGGVGGGGNDGGGIGGGGIDGGGASAGGAAGGREVW